MRHPAHRDSSSRSALRSMVLGGLVLAACSSTQDQGTTDSGPAGNGQPDASVGAPGSGGSGGASGSAAGGGGASGSAGGAAGAPASGGAGGASPGGAAGSRGPAPGATDAGAISRNDAGTATPNAPAGDGGRCRDSASTPARLLAFPGAEGFGAYAQGGRGGDVYHVTNTAASGAGSFANGITTAPKTGRTIVFDTGGYASISGTLRVTTPKLTIAGQTAPGDGFGVKDGTFLVSGTDVVIRHMRFRDGNSADSVDIDVNAAVTMWDHCDMLFSHDENMSSFNSPPRALTFQHSINAWGLETHSAGGLWDMERATSHHSLWAHNHTRNPKARALLLDWVNNVTFDWDIGFIMGDSDTPADWRANLRGSYFIGGTAKQSALESALLDRNGKPNFSIFMEDCALDGNVNGMLDVTKTDYTLASGSYTKLAAAVPLTADSNAASAANPLIAVPVTQDDHLTAYKRVVSSVGPLRLDVDPLKPLRDEVDALLIRDLVTQTHRHLNYGDIAANGLSNEGFGTLSAGTAPADGDRDGMPDYWEQAVGLKPAVDDHNAEIPDCVFAYVPAGVGYTALEDYLQWLAIPHGVVAPRATAAANSAIDVDMRKFTSGLAGSTVYTTRSAVGGTVTVLPDGYTARFVPDVGFVGRAGFAFAGTDKDKSTLGETVGILVGTKAP